jgi:hypothetical protein
VVVVVEELDGFLPGLVVVVVVDVDELVLVPSVDGLVGSVTPTGVVALGRAVNALAGPATTSTLKPAIAKQSEARRIGVLNFRTRKSHPNCVASLNQMPRRVANPQVSRSSSRTDPAKTPVHLVFSALSTAFRQSHSRGSSTRRAPDLSTAP